jgi:hypothetical protein
MVLAGIVGLGLVLMVLSAPFLPPLRVLVALGLILAGVVILKWRSFIRIYASAQFALEELLQDSPPPIPAEPPPPMPPLLRQAQLELIVVTPVHSDEGNDLSGESGLVLLDEFEEGRHEGRPLEVSRVFTRHPEVSAVVRELISDIDATGALDGDQTLRSQCREGTGNGGTSHFEVLHQLIVGRQFRARFPLSRQDLGS